MTLKKIKIADNLLYDCLFTLEHFLGYTTFQKIFGVRKKKLYAKIDNYLAGNVNLTSRQVAEVAKEISPREFMEQCYAPVLPKVLRGAANHWPAVKKWNLDFFENEHGHKEIFLNDNVGLTNQKFEQLTLKHYVKQLRSGSLKYLKFSDVINHDENLKKDFDMQWLRQYKLPLTWGEDMKMFMGGKNTVTPLHIGMSSFLFVQVMGRKKWIFYPAHERMLLDPRTERTFYFYSKANPYQKDDSDFPLLKYATQYEVILEPGDILWVPSFTWHHVENLTDSIGIRCAISSIPAAFKSSKLLICLFMLATRPTILGHFLTTMTKKRSYIFIKSQSELG